MDDELKACLKAYSKVINDKLDVIITNTTKKVRVKKEEDTDLETNIDLVMQDWKDFFNKPKVNIKSEVHRKPIRARLKQGYKSSDFIKVMENKSKDKYFIDNQQYFNPKTLFGKNFDIYLNTEVKVSREERKAQASASFFDDFTD